MGTKNAGTRSIFLEKTISSKRGRACFGFPFFNDLQLSQRRLSSCQNKSLEGDFAGMIAFLFLTVCGGWVLVPARDLCVLKKAATFNTL